MLLQRYAEEERSMELKRKIDKLKSGSGEFLDYMIDLKST